MKNKHFMKWEVKWLKVVTMVQAYINFSEIRNLGKMTIVFHAWKLAFKYRLMGQIVKYFLLMFLK